MKKILFLNPNKWGRGITAIWIASHSSILKKNGFEVKLFDSTFYLNWTNNETEYNTANKQYKKSKYFVPLHMDRYNWCLRVWKYSTEMTYYTVMDLKED